ncbi:MAG: hypothetical protein COV59_01230 [Candidatus Magasanikbacteria bacterium CG11_big_fil_rev_8_21_14_0_20_39_34]|uniref:Uncharacterized protein n=1 Tax=Candidatus Magasanikbacteria bacterium CG11_big_fil_rev_8_21_14_0_20_39_34 TaxID=1974653 RepID=A0A2H0N613_9BACT|nr:MAG: hypothetical protein COV59_01230 [Candidatus Magasanikbacteria bacterium CG11_big_fil_rev_8_21_14_0_20_39_34]
MKFNFDKRRVIIAFTVLIVSYLSVIVIASVYMYILWESAGPFCDEHNVVSIPNPEKNMDASVYKYGCGVPTDPLIIVTLESTDKQKQDEHSEEDTIFGFENEDPKLNVKWIDSNKLLISYSIPDKQIYFSTTSLYGVSIEYKKVPGYFLSEREW